MGRPIEISCRAVLLTRDQLATERKRRPFRNLIVVVSIVSLVWLVISSGVIPISESAMCGFVALSMIAVPWVLYAFAFFVLSVPAGPCGVVFLRESSLEFRSEIIVGTGFTVAFADIVLFRLQDRLIHLALAEGGDWYFLCPRLHGEDFYDRVVEELQSVNSACAVEDSSRHWRSNRVTTPC